MYESFETVQFWLGSISTGIVGRDGRANAVGTERGAALVFGQSENGRIAVHFYPFHTELPFDRQSESRYVLPVEALEPEDVVPARIERLVIDFLDWAVKTSFRAPAPPADMPDQRPRIGFHMPGAE